MTTKTAKKTKDKKTAAPAATQTQAAPVQIEEDFRILDLVAIRASKDNYRQTYDQKALDELTASVRTKGVLQPILVRPLKGNGTYEVVAGHRRRLAAIAAGRTLIPAIVRELSDADALEIQVIENSQREDPNIMEEARGFKRLLDIGKHTVETLADKLDRSAAYVLSRIKLLSLPKQAQDKIASGQISLGHALLLTRIRHDGDIKDFILTIEQCNLSVRDAAQQLRHQSQKLADAHFDTAGCEQCEFLSRNQTALFPELKKTDECMDRNCWQQKTRKHFQAIIDQRKKDGFKVLADKKKVEDLLGKGSKVVQMILPTGSKADYQSIIPRRYKSDCMKCTDYHVFYLYEKDLQRWEGKGKRVVFGELCINKKCLVDMNNLNKGTARGADNGDGAGEKRVSEHTLRHHAQACRDRFLRAQLPARVQDDCSPLSTRLAIYHLLDKLEPTPELREIVKKYSPAVSNAYDKQDFWLRHHRYANVKDVPAEKLGEMMQEIIVAGVQVTDPLVLLQMTPEAGIDMLKDFPVDETYLKTLTKDELLSYANVTANIALEGVTASSKNGDIIKAILVHDLRGKLPERVAKICTVDTISNDDDGEPITCFNCDKPAADDPNFNYEEDCCSECEKKFEKEEAGGEE